MYKFFSTCLAICLIAFLPAQAEEWRRVYLTFDFEAGSINGKALESQGKELNIHIKYPPLTDFSGGGMGGYIDSKYGALIPSESGWLPPLGINEMGWQVEVTAPEGFIAVPFPGGSIERNEFGAVSRFKVPKMAIAPLIAGRFLIKERESDGVLIRTFLTSENSHHSTDYLEAASEAISVLSASIGPYPYNAFSVVESPLPVGLGFPGFTLISRQILPMPFMRGRSLWHEIAHVWWGNGVFVDYERGNWAEGFAVFFADYALAKRRGANAAREMRFDWLLEFDALPPGDRFPLRQFVSKAHGHAQAIGYGKAAMVLEMLQQKIGVQVFNNCIQNLWNSWKFQRIGWAEIESSFNDCSAVDLSSFFKRWLDDSGASGVNLADRDFLIFRDLGSEERVLTLRLLLSASRLEPLVLPGAPGDQKTIEQVLGSLFPIGRGGLPILVGNRESIGKIIENVPPTDDPVIWVGRLSEGGGDAIAIAVQDQDELISLIKRSRHYGRDSWVALQSTGRAITGRW